MAKILPYQFEPQYCSDKEDNEELASEPEEEENYSPSAENRRTHTLWCSCERCVVMKKESECTCCKEITFLSKVVEGEPYDFCGN